VQNIKQKYLALELLKRLLNDEIKSRSNTNTTQGRKFSELLTRAVKRYQSGLIDSATIIQELLELARKIRDEEEHGVKLGLRVDELAFCDALAVNDGA
jgi:type I restriction enzyme R subunit